LLAGRAITERFIGRLEVLLADAPPAPESDLERAVRDLALAKIGGGVAKRQLQRLGERLARRGLSPV
ncbi:MAG: hypothetical protein ACE5FC_10090, partial [Myxococcota bacterium]